MLRRDFIAAIASFTAAGAAARSTLAALKCPEEKAGEWIRDAMLRPQEGSGAALVPELFADAIAEAVELRSQFERTIVACLRDGSMHPVGITSCRRGYSAFYRCAKPTDWRTTEHSRHDAVMRLYDEGKVVIEDVEVFNAFDAVQITFGIQP